MEKKEESASQMAQELNLSCYRCSLDVRERAHSDGRAEELAGAVLYLCEACSEKEQKKPDIQRVGQYRILQKLGRGEMTAVYKAWHEPTCRLTALKKMLPEFADSPWARILFEHEMSVAHKLIHPNIVRLIEHGEERGGHYGVFEYMTGGDLDTYTQMNPVPVAELCTMFCHVLEGLQCVHERGYVHRDVKPQNMLLTQDRIAKISDFALAKKIGEGEVLDPGWSVGPFGFASPEQILHFEKAGPSADVYSVGMSFYYILTRRFPVNFPDLQETIKAVFGEKAPQDSLELMADISTRKRIFSAHWENMKASILKEERVPLQYYRKDVPSGVARVIDKSVARHEEDRFMSADEMRCALSAHSKDY